MDHVQDAMAHLIGNGTHGNYTLLYEAIVDHLGKPTGRGMVYIKPRDGPPESLMEWLVKNKVPKSPRF